MRLVAVALLITMTVAGWGQQVIKNPVCYGQPIELYSSFFTGGASQDGATWHWDNFSGSWSITGTGPCAAHPVLTVGSRGYASDKFYLSIQYAPPDGGFSGGRVTVTVLPKFVVTYTKTDVKCYGGSDGSINLTVTGGTPPYTYLWNDGATTKNRSSLSAGTYTVTITDTRSCTNIQSGATSSVTITEPVDYMTLNGTISDAPCHDGVTGAVALTVTGGTAPYTYLWSNGATTQNLTNVAAGLYTVTVTDYNLCTTGEGYTVNEADDMTLSAIVTGIASCGGAACSGSIDLTVTGGTPPYRYLWRNLALESISEEQDIDSLCEGDIMVSVTDSNNCIKTATYTISLTTGFVLTYKKVNTRCGLPSGMINVESSCHGNTYTWMWSDGATTQNRMGLSAGTYGVTATDSNGATATKSITVN